MLCNINKWMRVKIIVSEWKSPVNGNHFSILLTVIAPVSVSRLVSAKRVSIKMY